MKSFYITSMLAIATTANEHTPEFVTKSETEIAQLETEEFLTEDIDMVRLVDRINIKHTSIYGTDTYCSYLLSSVASTRMGR